MNTQFSTQFLAQLVQRIFSAQSPKFFNILTTFFVVVGAAVGFITFEEKTFADVGRKLPEWVGTIKIILEGILFIGGPVAAQATIKTPDTPPLASEIEKPTLESQAKQIAELTAKIDALSTGQTVTPDTTHTEAAH